MKTYEAIPDTPNLLEALLLQPRDGLLNNGSHILHRMRIIAPRALCQPSHEVKALRPVELHRIAVEEVRDDGVVPIGGELVGHQLGVLPDPNHVGEVDDCGIFVNGLACRLGDVGFDIVDFDAFAGWLTAGVLVSMCPILIQLTWK